MATSYKSQAIAHELANRFANRVGLTALGIVEGFDTDSNPLITIGTGVAGTANFIVKVLPTSWPLAQDVLGLTALQYTPHSIAIVTEADPTGGAGADPTTRSQLLQVIAQSVDMGCHVDWYESASGVAPSAAAIVVGNLKASYDPDLWHPLINGQ